MLPNVGHGCTQKLRLYANVLAHRAANEITFRHQRSGEHERNEDGAAYLEARRKSWRERAALSISFRPRVCGTGLAPPSWLQKCDRRRMGDSPLAAAPHRQKSERIKRRLRQPLPR